MHARVHAFFLRFRTIQKVIILASFFYKAVNTVRRLTRFSQPIRLTISLTTFLPPLVLPVLLVPTG